MRQVAFAVPGREQWWPPQQHPRAAGQFAAFVRPLVLCTSQLGNRFIEQLRRKCPFPTPTLTRSQKPGDTVLSSVQGVPEDAGRKSKNATLFRKAEANGDKQHSRPLLTLWEPLIRSPREAGGQEPGST
jgi:hypothetical protein